MPLARGDLSSGELNASDKQPVAPVRAVAAPPSRLGAVTWRLAIVNMGTPLLGFLTAPLQARALGPVGRGNLAAILVPYMIAPYVANLGLQIYGGREAARGRSIGQLLGTLGALSLLIGLCGAALSPVLAHLIAGHRHVVYVYVLISFLLLPLTLLGYLLLGLSTGLQRWPAVYAARVVPQIATTIGIVVLFAINRLTVATAATVMLAGGLLALIPLAPGLLRGTRLALNGSMARAAIPFSFRAWLATLASLTNGRLDQLLMTRLAEPRQLGLYAIAATLATFVLAPVTALYTSLFPRVAGGDREVVARALRVAVAGIVVIGLLMAAVTPFFVTIVFGSSFHDSIPMVWILLLSDLPLGAATVLSGALVAAGRPGIPALAEASALVITVPGLILLLPSLGGIGAALVSVVAYTASFAIQLRVARREFGRNRYLLIRRSDLAFVGNMARPLLRRLSGRSAAAGD